MLCIPSGPWKVNLLRFKSESLWFSSEISTWPISSLVSRPSRRTERRVWWTSLIATHNTWCHTLQHSIWSQGFHIHSSLGMRLYTSLEPRLSVQIKSRMGMGSRLPPSQSSAMRLHNKSHSSPMWLNFHLPVHPYETVWHSSPSQSSPMSGCTWRTFPVLRCMRRATCTEMSSHMSHAQSEEVASGYRNKTWHVHCLVPKPTPIACSTVKWERAWKILSHKQLQWLPTCR